jgi:hypothetical protein
MNKMHERNVFCKECGRYVSEGPRFPSRNYRENKLEFPHQGTSTRVPERVADISLSEQEEEPQIPSGVTRVTIPQAESFVNVKLAELLEKDGIADCSPFTCVCLLLVLSRFD